MDDCPRETLPIAYRASERVHLEFHCVINFLSRMRPIRVRLSFPRGRWRESANGEQKEEGKECMRYLDFYSWSWPGPPCLLSLLSYLYDALCSLTRGGTRTAKPRFLTRTQSCALLSTAANCTSIFRATKRAALSLLLGGRECYSLQGCMNLASAAGLREAGITKPFKTEIGIYRMWRGSHGRARGTVTRDTF